ncbi:hypothetical protein ScPMuIL_003211 [Solemya velum]
MQVDLCLKIFLVILGLHTVDAESYNCPSPGTPIMDDSGGHQMCAYLPNTEASWAEAHVWCNRIDEYAMLPVIGVVEQQQAIESYLSSFNNRWTQYWISGSDAYIPDEWFFYTGQGSMQVKKGYTNWNPGYPRTDGNRDCMYINIGGPAPGTWGNDNCNEKKPFLCILSPMTE